MLLPRSLRLHLVRPLLAGLVALALASPARADPMLDDARRLLGAKDAKGALALLSPHETKRAGEVQFDYLLGVAAIDAGDPQRAVFALERVLAVQPDFHVARAEIARAYFALGERANAQREFRTVREQTAVPAEARSTIDKYLSALEPARTRLQGYLEGSFGYDTNVNSATALTQVAIPLAGGAVLDVTLNPSSVRRKDKFFGVGGGVTLSHELTEAWSVIGAASGTLKSNRRADQFDTSAIDASLGTRYALGQHVFTVAGQSQTFRLDDDRFRDSIGGLLQWQLNLSAISQFTTFYQQSRLSYPAQRVRDADRHIVGAAYAHAFPAIRNAVLFGSVYGGNEIAREGRFPHLGHKPLGLRLGGQLALLPSTTLFFGASHEDRRYNGSDPIFGTERHDRQTDWRVGLTYTIAPGWSLTPLLTHTDNRSNIGLNAFKRTISSVAVKRDF